MKELGFLVAIEEGERGQFELFKNDYDKKTSKQSWATFMKEGPGIPKFFTLHDVELKLSGHSTIEK